MIYFENISKYMYILCKYINKIKVKYLLFHISTAMLIYFNKLSS